MQWQCHARVLLVVWLAIAQTVSQPAHCGSSLLQQGQHGAFSSQANRARLARRLQQQQQRHEQQQLAADSDITVSVVMLNWMRPQNVRKIANTYAGYSAVEEIIIWMCNPETSFQLSHPKVRIIDDVSANDRDGLSTRFRACLLAKQPWVLIQDDDHYLKEAGLQKLIQHKQHHPHRIVGTFGRDWPSGEPPQYIRHPVLPGPARIMLTILLLTDQETCRAFWQYAPMVQDYVKQHSKPLWNGEDILLSLAAYKATGEVPLVVGRVAKVFMSQQGTGVHFTAQSSGFSGHDNYRDDFLKYAIEALQIDYGDGRYGRHTQRKQESIQGLARRRLEEGMPGQGLQSTVG